VVPQGRSLALTHPGGAGEHRVPADFADVLGQDATQAACFEASARALVARAVPVTPGARAESGVLLAYGVTGSGKTHSLLGGAQDPGVVPRALAVLFARVRQVDARPPAGRPGGRTGRHESAGSRRGSCCGLALEGASPSEGPEGASPEAPPRGRLEVRVSLYEAYNERLRDLLGAASGAPPVRLRVQDATRGASAAIRGLREVPVASEQEALEELVRGCAMRQSAGTGVHLSSSRSHLVFGVSLHWAGAPAAAAPVATLSFVDLAGSERLARTRNEGSRLQESFKINASLLVLGRCLETLHWNQTRPAGQAPRRVPCRDSKITHIFNRVLSGQGSLTLLVTVAPDSEEYDETVHVLRYAALASGLRVQQVDAPHPGGVDRARAPPAKRPRLLGTAAAAAAPAPAPAAAVAAAADTGETHGRCDACARAAGEAGLWREEAAKWEGRAREWQAEAEAVEAKVREEVAEEMSGLLREAEASFRARLETELAAAHRPAPPSTERPRTRRQTKIAGVSPSPSPCDQAEAAEQALERAAALKAALEAAQGALELQRAEAERAEADLRRRAELAEEELSRARATLRAGERGFAERLDREVEEARTQMLANNAMDVETLEIQLERQQERNDRLRHHLSRANTTVAALMDRVEDNAREQEASQPIPPPRAEPLSPLPAPAPAAGVEGGAPANSEHQAESPARGDQEAASPPVQPEAPLADIPAPLTGVVETGRSPGRGPQRPTEELASSPAAAAAAAAGVCGEAGEGEEEKSPIVAQDTPGPGAQEEHAAPGPGVAEAVPPTTVRRRRRLGPSTQAALETSPQTFMGGAPTYNKNLARVAGQGAPAVKGSPMARTPLARRTRAGRRALDAIENHLQGA